MLHQVQQSGSVSWDINYEIRNSLMLLEFIEFLTEGTRIDHPEDLIFSDGSQGAARAVQALAEVPTHAQDITIKWDGFPALVFGRNHDGRLVVADKHMFTKKDGSGRVTSLQAFVQYDVNRGSNRGDLYEKLKVLWPAFEQAVPKGTKGYYWGDLLWTGQLQPQHGMYSFKPNTVTYSVSASSPIGQRIAQSIGGIVVHQYFADFDQEPQVLEGTGQLNTKGPLYILTPNMPDQVKLQEPVQLVKAAQQALKTYGGAVDQLLDPTNLVPIRCKDLGQLMQKYINARVRGEARKFVDWLPGVVSGNKLKSLVGENKDGYLYQNPNGLNGAFAIFEAILNLKSGLIKQLDSQQQTIQSSVNGQPGGEGYVFNTSHGLIKLVNRSSFSAANFAKNESIRD